MPFQERIKNPDDLPVQLNVTVPFRYREHLRKQAKSRRKSMTYVVREALYEKHPLEDAR